jgi:thioredoxin-related protein
MKYFLLFVLTLTGSFANAQKQVSFIENDYEKAIKFSRDSNKYVFSMLFDEDCTHCVKMRKEVLTVNSVVEFLNQNFINLLIDSKTEFGRKFMEKHKITSTPAFLFFDQKENNILNFTGELKPDVFITESKLALDPKRHFTLLENLYKADSTNAIKVYNYINGIKRGIEKNKIETITNKYLATQTNDQLISVVNWKIMAIGTNDLRSKYFQFILNHQNEFTKITSAQRVEIKVMSVVKKTIKENIDRADTINYAKDRAIIKNIKYPSIDSLLFQSDLQIAAATKNWIKYKNIANAGTDIHVSNHPRTLTEIASNYYKHVRTSADVTKAISWAKKANDNSYFGNYLIAKLYKKVNDLPNAILYARKAKSIASQTKDIAEINKLFTELKIK